MPPLSSPNVKTLQSQVDPVVLGADSITEIGEAPFAGTVTKATYIAAALITGAATNNRTQTLTNRGPAGAGVAAVAVVAYGAASNAPAHAEKALVLSVTPANLVVAAGDVLTFDSTHIGTGIADPGGVVLVEITRGDVSS
jgi:hypothetical protein